MLDALAPSQVDEVISLLDRLAEATKRTAAEKIALSPDEVIADPRRWQLTDYLYALNDEQRGELIALMLVGRGDVQDFMRGRLRPATNTPAPMTKSAT